MSTLKARDLTGPFGTKGKYLVVEFLDTKVRGIVKADRPPEMVVLMPHQPGELKVWSDGDVRMARMSDVRVLGRMDWGK